VSVETIPGLHLKGARLLDPGAGIDEVGDLLVREGRLERLEGAAPEGVRVLDVSGRTVVPGFFDIHVHLREPGGEESETIASGCAAAIRGGVTTLYCMANTNPTNDDPTVTRLILRKAEEAGGLVDVRPVSAVTHGLRGDDLVDFESQAASGAGAFSDDGRPVLSDDIMARAMVWAAKLGKPLFSHAEDESLAAGGAIRESDVSRALGVKGIPAEAESAAVARDIEISRRTGAPVHICHVSTAGSVRLIRDAKAEGLPVTGETTPHHLTLTVESLRGGDPNHKMNPPLGDDEDRAEVRRGLAEGVFDAIATDHAPHAKSLKTTGLGTAAFGVVGMETMLPVLVTHVVEEGLLDLAGVIRLLTTGPAGVVGRPAASLVPGSRANLNVLDLETPWTIDVDRFASRSRNCPFDGWPVRGSVRFSIVGDRLVDHGEPGSRAEAHETA